MSCGLLRKYKEAYMRLCSIVILIASLPLGCCSGRLHQNNCPHCGQSHSMNAPPSRLAIAPNELSEATAGIPAVSPHSDNDAATDKAVINQIFELDRRLGAVPSGVTNAAQSSAAPTIAPR